MIPNYIHSVIDLEICPGLVYIQENSWALIQYKMLKFRRTSIGNPTVEMPWS